MFFGGFRPLTNANTNLKGKNAHHDQDINIYKIKIYQPQPTATFGHVEESARLPEFGNYKSSQNVNQKWQLRITDAPIDKPSKQAAHHEFAVLTRIMTFIMTRRCRKTLLSVQT